MNDPISGSDGPNDAWVALALFLLFALMGGIYIYNCLTLVISVRLYPNKRVTYTAAYWKDGTRTELTVESCEISKHDESYARPIGFITPRTFPSGNLICVAKDI